jgi:hypothetical protein
VGVQYVEEGASKSGKDSFTLELGPRQSTDTRRETGKERMGRNLDGGTLKGRSLVPQVPGHGGLSEDEDEDLPAEVVQEHHFGGFVRKQRGTEADDGPQEDLQAPKTKKQVQSKLRWQNSRSLLRNVFTSLLPSASFPTPELTPHPDP